MKVEPSPKVKKVEYLTVTIEVHAEKFRALEESLRERNLDFEQYVGRILDSHKRLPTMFSLNTKFMFGKYRFSKFRDIAAIDPGYIRFCLREVAGFVLDDHAQQYLNDIEDSLTKRAAGEDYPNMSDVDRWGQD